jgi:hypothetical protein
MVATMRFASAARLGRAGFFPIDAVHNFFARRLQSANRCGDTV